MSTAEIISAIPNLSDTDRREVLRHLLEAEEDAQALANSEQFERFQTLDAMEVEDEKSDVKSVPPTKRIPI